MWRPPLRVCVGRCGTAVVGAHYLELPLLGVCDAQNATIEDGPSVVVKCHYIGLRFCQEIFMPLYRALYYSGCHYTGPPAAVVPATICTCCTCCRIMSYSRVSFSLIKNFIQRFRCGTVALRVYDWLNGLPPFPPTIIILINLQLPRLSPPHGRSLRREKSPVLVLVQKVALHSIILLQSTTQGDPLPRNSTPFLATLEGLDNQVPVARARLLAVHYLFCESSLLSCRRSLSERVTKE